MDKKGEPVGPYHAFQESSHYVCGQTQKECPDQHWCGTCPLAHDLLQTEAKVEYGLKKYTIGPDDRQTLALRDPDRNLICSVVAGSVKDSEYTTDKKIAKKTKKERKRLAKKINGCYLPLGALATGVAAIVLCPKDPAETQLVVQSTGLVILAVGLISGFRANIK